ncbi:MULTISPECIES: UV DNA damage repair endonuclease UvsE [Bacillus]|jgi:UV DNA damage endonuclease|uniref:UV DNA damage repair endonuclease UvsE n=2 Tax=Bacillus pseudomycoides TaxID=64104 RepID=A0AAJ1Z1X0_9BACI|nr:UV DNA damage repair endonuclease UvsE [Bacillus pseudomycoides]EEM13063.1 UV DNA damage endonuclease [Bacillus pseudomycoides]KFN14652.1 UV damage endonuclease UvdE [Bacillus pseudomycoides]MBD5796179.1 UV damage endonuclease UvsE [Bacillus pseudomycoides]MCR8860332.1 UV DNA damage repair endonuclease UvsE [Bacillus pseudomycoides]MDR4188614.1 UV DNA damage repair endonuclease UvsE [Bacillus pseudomycoides]
MLVRLGYVAMSVHLNNASPSQTMTYAQFQRIKDREAAIHKLERIANSNLENCLRLLKHNKGHDIAFFRLSSKLIPLANHEELLDWNYIRPLKEKLKEVGEYANRMKMRIDFHPDHFVVLNSPQENILKQSIKTLQMHRKLLKGMGIQRSHRAVLHVGGGYDDKELALERFIENWSNVPASIQEMIMLENDDTTFSLKETLYLGEKLAVPVVFDLHHHMMNNDEEDWYEDWERVVNTWKTSLLPIKMHISSPREGNDPRAHADFINADTFLSFLQKIKGSVSQIDCMIEAKKKDESLFRLIRDLGTKSEVEMIDGGSFYIK